MKAGPPPSLHASAAPTAGVLAGTCRRCLYTPAELQDHGACRGFAHVDVTYDDRVVCAVSVPALVGRSHVKG